MAGANFHLGPYLVHPRSAAFERAGHRRRVDPMAMKVLVFLAERAGREVSRGEIFDVVWAGRTVSDETLTVAISTLRKALDDNARRPRYIETLPKYGYRLLVEPVAARSVPGRSTPPRGPEGLPRHQPSRTLSFVSAVALLAAVGLWLAHWLRPSQAPLPASVPLRSVAAAAMPGHPKAYEAYLQGAYLLRTGTEETLRRSVESFEQVIVHEPGFAPVYADLAEAWIRLGLRGAVEAEVAFGRAKTDLATALAGGAAGARIHALEGLILYAWEWNFPAAEVEFRRAVELDPSDPGLRLWYARYLTSLGRFAEAMAQVERQRELEPKEYPRPWIASILNLARRHDEALAELEMQIELEPASIDLRFELAQTYFQLGQPDHAFAELENLPSECASPDQIRRLLAEANGREGLCVLELQWLEARTKMGESVPAVDYARAYAGMGREDAALDWLEVSLVQREPGLLTIGVDAEFQALRENPRFESLLERIGLAQVL